MNDELISVKPYHDLYCSLSGRDELLSIEKVFCWRKFQEQGWTLADLRLALNHVKAQIRSGKKWDTALRFSKVVIDTEGFSETLAEAKALARVPKVAPSLRTALICTGRAENQQQVPVKVKTPADVMAGAKAFKQFKAWREQTGL